MRLVAEHVTVSRGGRALLSEVSVSLEDGELVALVGPNGAGKSTLLKVLTGAWAPDTGAVRLAGQPWSAWSAQERARLRAVVPQRSALAFPFEVAEVVRMGALPHRAEAPVGVGARWWRRLWRTGDAQAREDPVGEARRRTDDLVAEALHEVGLLDQARQVYTTLSGGERQRVHLARALVQLGGLRTRRPRLLMLDEPTASLDVAAAVDALTLARRLVTRGVGVLVVLHDLNLASLFADRVVALAQGRVLAQGDPGGVLSPALLERAYGIAAPVIQHPTTGRPVVLPPAPQNLPSQWPQG